MSRREELAAGLATVEDRVSLACAAVGRPRAELTLVAVTKTWPASDVALLHGLGLREFGENRDREAADKVAAARLAELAGVRWHYVGQVQTGKARSVSSYADVVHALDRDRLAAALGRGAVAAGRLLDVLVQVSLDGDPARGGALPEDVPALADLAAATEGLRLGGVMAVAPPGGDPAAAFDRLARVSRRVRQDHPEAGWISAGMSADLEAAVAAGATHLRVGTALLGHRQGPVR